MEAKLVIRHKDGRDYDLLAMAGDMAVLCREDGKYLLCYGLDWLKNGTCIWDVHIPIPTMKLAMEMMNQEIGRMLAATIEAV